MDIKYIGMDVHKEAIAIAVMNGDGKLVMESILETKAITILEFIQGVRGDLHVTFEEGTWAAWLYDLLKPHVRELVVCDPRKNALMKEGNKSDKIDARKLADLLRGGYLSSVYHGENGLRTLKELTRSYVTISKDLTRVMNRVKALYRSWGILCGGRQVRTASSRGVVEQDRGSRRAPAGRVFLPTARCSAKVAPSVHEGHEAGDGSPHLGAKDCGDHSHRLEERSTFRRETIETTSSLSVSNRESVPSFGNHSLAVASRVLLETLGSRESINSVSRRLVVLRHRVSNCTLCPLV